jgi:hypothetical protein
MRWLSKVFCIIEILNLSCVTILGVSGNFRSWVLGGGIISLGAYPWNCILPWTLLCFFFYLLDDMR